MEDSEGVTYVGLGFSAEASLHTPEPTDSVIKYRVEVNRYDESGEPEVRMGHFDVWLFMIAEYIDSGCGPVFELFDADSREAYDLYHALFDPKTDDWKEELAEDRPLGHDLIYFQWAEFPPELRRSNTLLAVAERIIHVLGGGCAFAALWPWDNPHPDMRTLTSEELSAYWRGQDENEEFWGRMSFRRLKGTAVLVRYLVACRGRPP